jgi:ABC-2 type transport system permease protein
MIGAPGNHSPGVNANLSGYVWKLLRLRWMIFIRSFQHSKTSQKIGYAFLVLVLFGLMIGAFFFSSWLLNFITSDKLRSYIGDPTPFLEAVPTIVLSVAFGGIIITSFGVLLQALYLANDMEFLLSSPVPMRAVFLAKMLQAILPNIGLIMLFGLPVLYGLGISQNYSIIYYPVVILMMVLMAITAASLASLLVMVIVRIFPARRVAEVLAFIGAILSFVCGQSGQIFRFGANNSQTVDALYSLSRINAPWFPLAWAGRSLIELGSRNWIAGGILLIFITGFSGVIIIISMETAERLYYTGWATTQMSLRRRKTPRVSSTPTTQRKIKPTWIGQLIPAPVRAIVVKDFIVIRRDIRNLSQLVTPLIFGVLYTFMLLRDSGGASQNGAPSKISVIIEYGNTGIALFVGWMLLMRLALIAFSQEGKNYWLLKVSPINTQRLLAAKYLVAFLPSTALGWLFLVATGIFHPTSLFTTIYGLIVITLSFAGMSGVLLSFGVTGANLEWSDPRQMIRGSAGCTGSLVGLVYIVMSGGLFYAPLLISQSLGVPQLPSAMISILIGGVFNLVCAYFPLQLVFSRLEHLGES